MFFRFGAGLLLVVLISLAGTALEKRNLELKRAVSRQHFRLEILREQHVAQRVLAQQQGAPARLIEQVEVEPVPAAQPVQPAKPSRKPNRQKRQSPVATNQTAH
jgi:hypothetical protein